ncbi:pilus assembly PilX family protein [Pseudomonas oryzihabitans]|uniref:pilus assembly PilX family protein n=1 Tax=Pseudomonas oryzihabitans TaxID=47885 RepID=UPI001620C28A|nr:PilX N-terminal domain-containing pilus assembly protein [Pseudomonas psychrotolerans]UUW71653.1 PilX N-terminal domain-containing pilus assembly protein [Pseudomonas psychrotolerans]
MKNSSNRQNGAVLIVTLVMLLLMTLIAIGSMRGTVLQERMAGNLRDENLAFQTAEMAQRDAEQAARNRSVADWQTAALTTAWTNATTLSNQGQATYRMNPLPGVTIRKAGDSIEAGVPVTTSVIRIESRGLGSSQDSASTPAASSTVNISTLYIRR